MSKILVVGSSSGLGRALVKTLVKNNYIVWGVARRQEFLDSLQTELKKKRDHFNYSAVDITQKGSWQLLISHMREKNFKPDAVVFLAAINPNDFNNKIDLNLTFKIMKTNFFAVLEGVNYLLPYLGLKAHFIAISSSSAFKGSANEGVGYSASKASLSLAFEALYQRYHKSGPYFSTIYFGPVNTGMKRYKHKPFFTLSEDQAVEAVLQVLQNKRANAFYPFWLIFIFRFAKLILPNMVYLKLIGLSERKYNVD